MYVQSHLHKKKNGNNIMQIANKRYWFKINIIKIL